VLCRSLVFSKLAKDNTPVMNYDINGHAYNKSYYLADCIYHNWFTLVKTIHVAEEEKK
jgi:hypothetical protein